MSFTNFAVHIKKIKCVPLEKQAVSCRSRASDKCSLLDLMMMCESQDLDLMSPQVQKFSRSVPANTVTVLTASLTVLVLTRLKLGALGLIGGSLTINEMIQMVSLPIVSLPTADSQ